MSQVYLAYEMLLMMSHWKCWICLESSVLMKLHLRVLKNWTESLTPAPLSDEMVEEFLDSFNPLQECDDYGIELYTSAKDTLSVILSP